MSAWKYAVPSNENAKKTVDGVDWWFCKHCKGRATAKKGFWTKHSSVNHMFCSTPGESGTAVEVNEEEETPAASLNTVDEHDDKNDDTLAWEGFMSPVEDSCNLNMVTVVVEETEIEAPLPPTLRIRGGDIVATVMARRKNGR